MTLNLPACVSFVGLVMCTVALSLFVAGSVCADAVTVNRPTVAVGSTGFTAGCWSTLMPGRVDKTPTVTVAVTAATIPISFQSLMVMASPPTVFGAGRLLLRLRKPRTAQFLQMESPSPYG